jgi:hypothetical protein
MSESKYFYVETQGSNGTWRKFTAEPIEGQEAAEKHMETILDSYGLAKAKHPGPNTFGYGLKPVLRIQEETKDDRIESRLEHFKGLSRGEQRKLIEEFPREEQLDFIAAYIQSLPRGEFWRRVQEARKAELEASKAIRCRCGTLNCELRGTLHRAYDP